MRSLYLIAGTALCVFGAPNAMAQSAPAQTADEVCLRLTGEVCDAPAGAELKVGEEADFSFRRAGGAAKPAKAVVADAAPRPAVRTEPRPLRKPVPRPVVRPVSSLDMRLTFAMGSAELTSGDEANVREFARALMSPKLAARRVRIEGHTDSVGDRDYNLQLSRDRAASVQKFLVAQGVPANRLESEGYGFDRPLVKGRPRAAANRRVQLVLID